MNTMDINFLKSLKRNNILDLSGLDLYEVPKEILEIKGYNILNLSYNNLKELPDFIADIKGLTTIDVSYNPELVVFPNRLDGITIFIGDNMGRKGNFEISYLPTMPDLSHMTLKLSNIHEIDESILRYKNLKMLMLSNNPIKDIKVPLSQLKRLESFELAYTSVKDISNLLNMRKLYYISISNTHVNEIPDGFFTTNDNLHVFYGDSVINGLKIPESICNAKNLTDLKISGDRISDFPECIGNLKNLKYVDIGDNPTHHFPNFITQLHNLKRLDIYRMGIDSIPDEISRLHRLESLYAYENNLKELPESIGRLTNLKYLNLAGNIIEKLPKSITNLTKLRKLYLQFTNLSELPDDIGNLRNLEELDIRYTNVKKLPNSISDFVPGSITILCNRLEQIYNSITGDQLYHKIFGYPDFYSDRYKYEPEIELAAKCLNGDLEACMKYDSYRKRIIDLEKGIDNLF